MTILGIHSTTNAKGEVNTTLHVSEDFEAYYLNPEDGRNCVGKKVSTIYAGKYDCSALKVGMEIDVLYGKANSTTKGTFQSVKRIEILSKQ